MSIYQELPPSDKLDILSWFEPKSDHGPGCVDGMEALFSDINYESSNAIKAVCDKFGKYLDIDNKWALQLRRYVYNFITRRVGVVDYQEFFGSPYLGLQKITFTTGDRNLWFSEIFDVDEEELKENLHEVKAVEKEWNVVGDVFNLTIPYLLFRVYHSKLDQKTKHQALVDIICMYHYKCFTSIIHNDYPYQARREVVIETYNRLSLKYDIKRYGSWKKLIEARAEFILDPKTGIHFEAYSRMEDDKKIIYMVGDIQNRFRRLINDINKVFHDVKNKTDIVSIEGAKVNLKDEVTIKSVQKDAVAYNTYIERILTEETSFFKPELVKYASSVLEHPNTTKLEYIVQQLPGYYKNPKKPKGKQFIDAVITHMIEYLHANNIKKTNVYDVLVRLRGAYGAPKSKNDTVKEVRTLGEEIVKELSGVKTPITVQSLRAGLSLYIVIRILSKDLYD
jgi:hypothetical protein